MSSHWKQALEAAANGSLDAALLPGHMHLLKLPILSAWQEGEVTIPWCATEEVHQGGGVVFGGYIAALADYAAGLATVSVLGDDENFATVEMTTSLIHAITTGPVQITARVIGRSRQTLHAEVFFTNADDRLCAKGKVVQLLSSSTQ